MTFETIRIEHKNNGIVWLVLNRPEVHNALSSQMIGEITIATGELDMDDSVRVVVLASEGKSFCAGGDLGWMREQFAATREQRMDEARRLAHMLRDLNSLSKPLIGRVQGQAFGGGIGMMSVCDYVAGVEGMKFGLTEVRLGLIPATISPYVVARMGEDKARQVFMNGGLFDTKRAHELGIVSQVVDAEDLDMTIDKVTRAYLSAAPSAVAASKDLVLSLGQRIDDAVIEDTIRRLADTWETPEAQEGIAAFFEKRSASWVTKNE